MTVDGALLIRVAAALGWEVPFKGVVEIGLHRRPDGSQGFTEPQTWLLTGDGCLAVVEAMRAKGWRVYVGDEPDDSWACVFERMVSDEWSMIDGFAPTAPEAVILAAARALGVE